MPGDLTGDGIVTSEDIDALYSAINAGLTESRYDLDSSGKVVTEFWYLVDPALGGNLVTVDMSGGSGEFYGAGSMSFTGVYKSVA